MNPAERRAVVWSWSATEAEVAKKQDWAAQFVGQRIIGVRYFTLDYERGRLAANLINTGPRLIRDREELEHPTWRHAGFDAIDYGLEFRTDRGHTVSLTWDPPGQHEGIGLHDCAMLGSLVAEDADVAIADVSGDTRVWADLLDGALAGVELHYRPWPSGGFWCERITFVGRTRVDIVLGDASDGVLVPAADNVAIVHPGSCVPEWLVT